MLVASVHPPVMVPKEHEGSLVGRRAKPRLVSKGHGGPSRWSQGQRPRAGSTGREAPGPRGMQRESEAFSLAKPAPVWVRWTWYTSMACNLSGLRFLLNGLVYHAELSNFLT